MVKVMLFSGTTEGRKMAEFLNERKLETMVFVATEYGEMLSDETEFIRVMSGRLTCDEMKEIIERETPKMVIDATHPFAAEVTKNIKSACECADVKYLRLLRDEDKVCTGNNAIYVSDIKEAAEFLNQTEGNALITTGSKEIEVFTKVKDFKERLFIRILPMTENLAHCSNLGFKAKNIICMQGPFSQKSNEAMLEFADAKYLVTKETGSSGGFGEKIDACREKNVIPVIIGRPKEKGLSYTEVKEQVLDAFCIKESRKVFVIGAGLGGKEWLTVKALNAINESNVIITTKRIWESLGLKDKIWLNHYKPDEIERAVKDCDSQRISVIFSGDIGFYSGAKELRKWEFGCETEYISGISSLVYFMNKLGKSYENVKTISLHGRNENYISHIKKEKKVLLLLGGENTAKNVCRTLSHYNFEDISVSIGENLGNGEEQISVGKARDFVDKDFQNLALMLIENENTATVSYGFDDSSFIRGSVPMTKSEVRSVSLSKLKLEKDSVIYDIGAGTGSVSCEMALLAAEGTVYAIEKEEKAVELIIKNKFNLGADNVNVVLGNAPRCLENLTPPSHVFIGGSSGNLREILNNVFKKNMKTRVVINAVSLETMSLTLEFLKERNIEEYEVINLSVSKNRRAGKMNLMEGQNPIYVISFGGKIKEMSL